ncbi:MAG: S-methyl-5-thioribose-1-phosphate isomerase [Deinococcota bacterium]
MNVNGKPMRTIWLDAHNPGVVHIIDQQQLPHVFEVMQLRTLADVATAIKDMHVRGAGLIGATAGYGMYLAALDAPKTNIDAFLASLEQAASTLQATRPTAVNLAWACSRQLTNIRSQMAAGLDVEALIQVAKITAQTIADEDANFCKRIGEHGLPIIHKLLQQKSGDTINILTHCNAGWLAFVDYGSATAPIYAAFNAGIPLHVWVDETRPRNQGASLTAWELGQHGVPHTIIADNVGGHLMQHGLVDMVIVGSDRTSYTGDVGNKIGTYLKALAAKDNNVPFYAALPSSTFDWALEDGVHGTPIEERAADEVTHISGVAESGPAAGQVTKVRITPETSPAKNYGFDVTPRRLVTGLITERGVCAANAESVLALYPEKRTLVEQHKAVHTNSKDGGKRVVSTS